MDEHRAGVNSPGTEAASVAKLNDKVVVDGTRLMRQVARIRNRRAEAGKDEHLSQQLEQLRHKIAHELQRVAQYLDARFSEHGFQALSQQLTQLAHKGAEAAQHGVHTLLFDDRINATLPSPAIICQRPSQSSNIISS